MLITRTICCRLELILGLTVRKHSALFRLGWHVGNVFYLETSCLSLHISQRRGTVDVIF